MDEEADAETANFPARPFWILTRATVRRLAALKRPDPGRPLGTLCVLEPWGSAVPAPGWVDLAERHWLACPSYARLREAIVRGTFPAWADTVLYDCEAWAHTPRAEQVDPWTHIRLAAELCHTVGVQLVGAPSMNLARQLLPHSTSSAAAYLELGLAETCARWADGLHVHAQSLERRPHAYAHFVRSVVARVRHSTSLPVTRVTAGLSTNPPGTSPTEAQLVACIRNTRESVGGYWLNVPVPGRWCPTCSPPRPDLAYAVLQYAY